MTPIPTSDEVKKYFPHIHIALVRIFVALLYLVLHKETVNLNKCKKALGKALGIKGLSTEAAYKRLLRFFNMKQSLGFCIGVSYLMFSLVLDPSSAVYLAIDRTNWQIGKQHKVNINVLALGLVLPNGCFVPLVWQQLDKKGNSNQGERQELLSLFIQLFADYLPTNFADKSFILLGDREFIGKKWFKTLSKQMNFVIRVRKDDYLHALSQSLNCNMEALSKKIRRRLNRDGFLFVPIQLDGQTYHYVITPNDKKGARDKWVRFVSSLDDFKSICKAYYERWQIEVFFKHCKSNGFRLEDLNLKKQHKVMLMIAVVGCAYLLAIRAGMIAHKLKPIKEQKFGKDQVTYKRKSIFKLGYEQLETQIFDLQDLLNFILKAIEDSSYFNEQILCEYHTKYLKSIRG